MQPENQSWIVTFIKLTDLNLKFASPNCSILKKKGHKYAAIDIFWRCWDESYILDVLWGQPIKLIQVVSTSEFHEY